MESTLRIRTTVQPGGRVEVVAPDLPVGESVEVTIRAEVAVSRKRSALEILSGAPGHRLFNTAEEVNAHVRKERDSWDC